MEKCIVRSSHTVYQENTGEVWWGRVLFFDKDSENVLSVEGAHKDRDEAIQWAVATEKIMVNVWIVPAKTTSRR